MSDLSAKVWNMPNATHLSEGLNPAGHLPPISGQILGYARVSSASQNLERQRAALHDAGVQKLWEDTITGATRDRPALNQVLDYAREGDLLVVVSMDRLARSVPDLHSIVSTLTDRGVAVKFLKENQTYTANSDPTSRFMLSILGAVAQLERELIRERQADGIAAAKARGVYERKPILTPDQVAQAREMVSAGVPKAVVARRFEIARSTLYKYLTDDADPTNEVHNPDHRRKDER